MEREKKSTSEASYEEVVGDSEQLEKKMAAIRTAGPAKLQVASCFVFVTFKSISECKLSVAHFF